MQIGIFRMTISALYVGPNQLLQLKYFESLKLICTEMVAYCTAIDHASRQYFGYHSRDGVCVAVFNAPEISSSIQRSPETSNQQHS